MTLEGGFRIGGREVIPLEGRIVGPAGALRVEPKAMSVLLELARHAPAVRTREQILQAVWPRGFVSDDALTRCIGQLRRALGDESKAQTWLETVPKRGYRLKVPAQTLVRRDPADDGRVARNESLIVLPFQNLSAGAEDFVADGLTELLILRLAGLGSVRVISRTTSMQFKATRTSLSEIAARTAAQWVIEGSVLQSGNLLQVVVQLIDARTDAHLWAADYLRELSDLLPLQNEIAASLAAAIGVRLGAAAEAPHPRPTTLASAVMRDYLRGRTLISRRTVAELHEARRLFDVVAEAAPGYAAGWASLAECDLLLAHYGAPDPERLIASCERNVERALVLDPELGIALSTRGAARFFFRCDLDAAARDLQRALGLLPSYSFALIAMANVCTVRREFDEARAWIGQALLVDPLDVGVNMNFGDHMILQRRYGEALQGLRRALAIAPGHRPSRLRSGWALALDGQHRAGTELLNGIGPADETDAPWFEYAALVAGACGDADSALRHYEALVRWSASQRVPAWSMARAATAARQHDAALNWLEAAVRERSSSLPFLALTPAFDALHAEARFRVMLDRLTLPLPAPGGDVRTRVESA
ncbi:MAG: winged helix-turn-helix domain-containing protein [Burkholderiaceae bacterium]|jgi:TolB-like protein|nr:winged helix-turn-helix domain-containing protein [Burkholderiaceae bacterium]MEB2352278.1 winged helix-turn-helix domain-containing protein [Burkholderiaceae bacterium]